MGRKRKRRRRFVGSLTGVLRLFLLYLLLPLVVGAGAGGFMAFARSVPSIAELRQDITPPSTRIYADDDTLIGELKITKGKYVRLESLPQELLNAVVAVEDSHFWEHSGVDYLAIARAAAKDLMKRHLKEGGSTITQQLAKMTFLTSEKTFTRKLKEFVLAQRIEQNLTKEEILELYLNRAYFGHGAYGAAMAAQVYFDKTVADLTLAEAALVAGLLKAPSTYSPLRHFERARTRQGVVLWRMEEEGFITRRQKEEALAAEVFLSRASLDDAGNSYFLEYIRRHLEETFGQETVYKGGLRVYTTLDRQAQAEAQRALKEGLRDLDKRRGWRGPAGHRDVEAESAVMGPTFRTLPPAVGEITEGVVLEVGPRSARVRVGGVAGVLNRKDAEWARKTFDEAKQKHKWISGFNLAKILSPGDIILVKVKAVGEGRMELALEQEPEVQGALVAIESQTGYIRALVGGFDFTKSQFNRALYAQRQPGSAFKPVIYAVALRNGYTPATVVMDEEITFETSPEDVWTPKNYDEEFHGATRLRDALAYSRNVVTVKVLDEIGIERVMRFARQMGMEGEMPRDLTISLGTMSITPLDMTSVYGAFANGGVQMQPIGIQYVTDRRGRVIESNEPRGRRVMEPETAFLMTSMLRSVVEYGTGWRARGLKRPVAGKTGTTNDYRDAWFLGYSTDLVTGVWVGFDDPRPLGPEETGSRAAAPVWVDFMRSVGAGASGPAEFPRPEGIVSRYIDPETGLLANRWTERPLLEYFAKGSEPTEYAPTIWETRVPNIFN